MVALGAGEHHIQGATRLGVHPGYDRLNLGGDSAEDQGWLQYPPPVGRRDKTVWGEAEVLLHSGGASGTSPSTPDTQPVGTPRIIHA